MSDQEKIAALNKAKKELAYQNEEKEKRAAELKIAKKELAYQNEEKEKRAAELKIAKKELAYQNEEKEKRAAELKIAKKELAYQNKEKKKRAVDLVIAKEELTYQSKEKRNRAEELVIAKEELTYQSKEKRNRAAELTIAKEALDYQNKEKEKRAAELLIADKELAFQKIEKEKRAAELLIADKELAFQNKEKEQRAAELFIADKELAFQKIEKEQRAAELFIANKELAYQSKEKRNRAAELLIANKELAYQSKEKRKRASELSLANKDLLFQNKVNKKLAIELTDSSILIDELENRVKATKDLESFSYSVSHDLRTPLRAISGYAKILEEDYSNVIDAEGKRLLGEVISNAKRMGMLIDGLLTFSRLGRKAIQKSHIDMNTLVRNVLSEISASTVLKAKINFSNLLPVVADYNLLYHVITNLLSNAIKYSSKKEKPVIEIKSLRENEMLVYEISDNGIGFDMQYVHKLFGVFHRLHSNEEFPGTGVGLAIVQRIIEKHDGMVWAKGKEGRGATFYFSLPDIDIKTVGKE
jgi:signal transduction histidine kinase